MFGSMVQCAVDFETFNAYLNILLSIQNFSNFKVFLVISKQSTLVDDEDLGILGVLRKILGLGVINPAR